MPRPAYTVLWPRDRRHYLSVEWHPVRRPRRPPTPRPEAPSAKASPSARPPGPSDDTPSAVARHLDHGGVRRPQTNVRRTPQGPNKSHQFRSLLIPFPRWSLAGLSGRNPVSHQGVTPLSHSRAWSRRELCTEANAPGVAHSSLDQGKGCPEWDAGIFTWSEGFGESW